MSTGRRTRVAGGGSVVTSSIEAVIEFWVLISPFVLSETFGLGDLSGPIDLTSPFWNTLLAGVLVVLAGVASRVA